MSTEHRESDLIRSWLDETYEAERDPHDYLDHLLDEVTDTPQQRRRWWHPPRLGRARAVPTSTDTTEYQPSPIPASNGHTPTVIGRTSSMLSPVKAITAGAIVFALGGVLLIAQPFEQESGVPGAAIDRCTMPVVPVTGTIIWGGEGPDTQRYLSDSGEHVRNFVFNSTMYLSDDRLSGSTTATGDHDQSEDGGIYRGTRVIENDDGTWEGPETLAGSIRWGEGFYSMSDLTGTGAYDGLSAVLFMENNIDRSGVSILGSIYPTDLASCDFSTDE